MTTPEERTRAVLQTEDFLMQLTNPQETPRIPKEIRQEARRLLRHYPGHLDIEITRQGWNSSMFMECPFGLYEGD